MTVYKIQHEMEGTLILHNKNWPQCWNIKTQKSINLVFPNCPLGKIVSCKICNPREETEARQRSGIVIISRNLGVRFWEFFAILIRQLQRVFLQSFGGGFWFFAKKHRIGETGFFFFFFLDISNLYYRETTQDII